MVRQGEAWLGMAWYGKARHGKAGQGKAWRGKDKTVNKAIRNYARTFIGEKMWKKLEEELFM